MCGVAVVVRVVGFGVCVCMGACIWVLPVCAWVRGCRVDLALVWLARCGRVHESIWARVIMCVGNGVCVEKGGRDFKSA
jgi:hypothetical protein